MKNIVVVTLAGLMVASASAMPTEGGEHSYSFQGKATSVRAVSRNRNIPAASSWTPPERIKSPNVVYVRREQPTKLGGGTSFSSPSFSNPSFSNPNFSNPNFSSPNYNSPSFSNPGFSNPNSSSPNFSSPNSSSPSYSNPGYSNPSL